MFSKFFQSLWPNGGAGANHNSRKRRLEDGDLEESPVNKRPKPKLGKEPDTQKKPYTKVAEWISHGRQSFCDNYYIRKVASSPKLFMKKLSNLGSNGRGNQDNREARVAPPGDHRQMYHPVGTRSEMGPPETHYGADMLANIPGMPVHSTPVNPPAGYGFTESNCDLGKPNMFSFHQSPVEAYRFQAAPGVPPRYQDTGFTPVNRLQRPPIRGEREEVQRRPGGNGSVYDTTFSAHNAKRRANRPQRNRARLAVKDSIRLEERNRYAGLLQQFTSAPIPGTAFGSMYVSRPSTRVFASNKRNETILGSQITNIGPDHAVKPSKSPLPESSAVAPNKTASPPRALNRTLPDSGERRDAPEEGAWTKNKDVSPSPVVIDLSSAEEEESNQGSCGKVGTSDIIEIGSSSSSRPMTPLPTVTSLSQKLATGNRFLSQSLNDARSTRKASLDQTSLNRSVRDSKYLTNDWLDNFLSKHSTKIRREKQLLVEQEIQNKHFAQKRADWDKDLENRIRHRLHLSEREPTVAEDTYYEEEEEEEEEEFPELTEEQESRITAALTPFPPDQILSEAFKLQIRRQDLQTLNGLNWLNDEVINFYMNLLVDRGSQEGTAKVHAFNTFFYPKIMSSGQAGVKRWTKKIDVFALDYILVPVHLGMHWCLAVIDFRKKEIRYYDSMGGQNKSCLEALRQYLVDESLDKKNERYDTSDWKLMIMKGIPQQMNGSDCGMFACKFAEYVTRDAPITFTQEHMPYFRRRMVLEILNKSLL